MIDFDFESAPGLSNRGPIRLVAAPSIGGGGALPDYLTSLNDRQREAALITEGPLIVLAGAGSGKTKNVDFANGSSRGRLWSGALSDFGRDFLYKQGRARNARTGRKIQGIHETSSIFGAPEIGTFHSICVRILRRERRLSLLLLNSL